MTIVSSPMSKSSRRPPRRAAYYSVKGLLYVLACSFCDVRTMALSSTSAATSATLRRTLTTRVVTIPEHIWRQSAAQHSKRIRSILGPGLTDIDHPINLGRRRALRRNKVDPSTSQSNPKNKMWTALDPRNPVFNFLIEYYGFKGGKGPRRLARWSPDPGLLLCSGPELEAKGLREETRAIFTPCTVSNQGDEGRNTGGILLEGATGDDFGGTLHFKGVLPAADGDGMVYSPSLFYAEKERQAKIKAAAPFQWYRSILSNTLDSEPVMSCHGLHEWAMQFHPKGADPPPSGKYQSHMQLRVSREVINSTVERRGIRCTHVDALRFFAPAAAPLNHHGAQLQRTDQLRLEQKGCVHAHMDLLKISTKLQPFVDASLVADTLELALTARRLDIEASPYDVTAYGLGVVPVETSEGREEYRIRQKDLMNRAEPVRQRLLNAYDKFLSLSFDDDILLGAVRNPAAERYARAQPGGAPWRRNLIESTTE